MEVLADLSRDRHEVATREVRGLRRLKGAEGSSLTPIAAPAAEPARGLHFHATHRVTQLHTNRSALARALRSDEASLDRTHSETTSWRLIECAVRGGERERDGSAGSKAIAIFSSVNRLFLIGRSSSPRRGQRAGAVLQDESRSGSGNRGQCPCIFVRRPGNRRSRRSRRSGCAARPAARCRGRCASAPEARATRSSRRRSARRPSLP
jgi:hypothetical protein